LLPESLAQRFAHWIEEDAPDGDETSRVLIDPGIEARAAIIAKGTGILAGMDEMAQALALVGLHVVERNANGDELRAGQRILLLEGDARTILLVERTLLNILSHCSGIATMTRSLVKEAEKRNPKVRVAATRKTLPGMRQLEKEAVRVGGGDTHRLNLSSMLLIKDNHLKIVDGVEAAVSRARQRTSFVNNIEIEVSNAAEAIAAAKAGADVIMLDNFSPDQAASTLRRLKRLGLRDKVAVEASGGIDERNIGSYAALDVDAISTGRITNSAGIIDMSLEVEKSWKRGA
jgi:nicotinate-nucleotide pyrophosphorylase (carboxylating)